MRLRYAALSDVGRVRRDNQDSGYAGPHLLVIADGVGGSARGDIASSATVQELRRLDEPPGNDMLSALAGAIHRSHDRLADLVAESPEIEGTSTTVTAAIFDGTHLGVGHVGDSRGYLLRDGQLAQLTTDHTFVQSLIDEGRITEDEARVHPHRNLILRAVDGVHEPEPDVFTLEMALGDRVLLCSDGCSGVLDEDELARILADGSPDHAAVALVNASLDAGSTDNVTVVVADLVEDDAVEDPETSAAATTGAMIVGAAAEQARRPSPRAAAATRPTDTGELEPYDEDGRELGSRGADDDVDPEELRYAPRAPRRFVWLRRLIALGVVLALVGVILVAAYRWTQGQYYVSNQGDQVVIYRGVEADVPGVRMHSVEEESDLMLADLPTFTASQVREGISATSLPDAREVISRLEDEVTCPPSPTPTPKPTAKATDRPDAKPSAKPSPTAKPSPSDQPSDQPGDQPSPTPTRTPAVCTQTP